MKIAPVPPPLRSSVGDDLDHIYCCDPNIALCGTDISDQPEDDNAEGTCVVCLDLEFALCRLCRR